VIRFVDLFAGIGGIRLGFEQALAQAGIEHECVLSSEISVQARRTYALNFGEEGQGDIYAIRNFPKFDFLLAGFPCQPFSYAGKQKGFGDTRGTLFFEIERRIAHDKPEGFLLENVRGLTTHDGGRTLATIVANLESLGYGVRCLLLNSSDFDVPQNRVRVYILGLKGRIPQTNLVSSRGASDSHQFRRLCVDSNLFGESRPKLVKDILEENPPAYFDCSASFTQKVLCVAKLKKLRLPGLRMIDFRNGHSLHSWELGIKGTCTPDEVALMNALVINRRKKIFGTHQDGKSLTVDEIRSFFNHPDLLSLCATLVEKKYLRERGGRFNPVSGNMSFEVFKILDQDSVSITLVSSDAHKLGIYDGKRLRRLTPRECARIQGYPDTFNLHPDDAWSYHQLGNSVSVPVIKAVVADLIRCNGLWADFEASRAQPADQLLVA
jgi:DNA (cytosine-5)-methyltransferase 1